MFTTIITDCKGENEAGRQETRYNALGLGPCVVIGVSSTFKSDSTIEAAGNLIDALDASLGEKGTIVVNVAPRGVPSDGTNGNYFCYFFYKDTLVISSTKGYCLSLLEKFEVASTVHVLHTEEVLEYAKNKDLIKEDMALYIGRSQFRSFDFVPRVAKWIHEGVDLPSELISLDTIQKIPFSIWCIDAFGNCKTTVTNEEIQNYGGETLFTNIGDFQIYERLKDVPEGETAFYIGSSGLGERRFLEIATQNKEGSAAKTLDLTIGTQINIKAGRQ
jgi:hypothetical protein